MIVPDVHPPMLGRNECGAENKPADDGGGQGVQACAPATDGRRIGGEDIARCASKGSSEINHHVETE